MSFFYIHKKDGIDCSCGRVIHNGTPRFGPPELKCKKCGEKIHTLLQWKYLSLWQKIISVLAEVFFPAYCNSVEETSIVVIMYFSHFALLSLYPIGVIIRVINMVKRAQKSIHSDGPLIV